MGEQKKKGFRVCSHLCKTCIFTKNSPISDSRFEELKKTWEEEEVVQQCHTSNIEGGDVACRGHYNAAKRGEIPYKAYENTFDKVFPSLAHMSMKEKMEIGIRLGIIIFEDVG